MTTVSQYNATIPIRLRVVVNGGDFRGAEGLASQLTVKLSKNGQPQQNAKGSIAEGGSGIYWLMPNPSDADTIGPVAVTVITPTGYIAEPVEFEVEAPSFWQYLAAAPQNIATVVSLLQRLVTAQRA